MLIMSGSVGQESGPLLRASLGCNHGVSGLHYHQRLASSLKLLAEFISLQLRNSGWHALSRQGGESELSWSLTQTESPGESDTP